MDDDKNTTIENDEMIVESPLTHSRLIEKRTVEDVMEDSFLRLFDERYYRSRLT